MRNACPARDPEDGRCYASADEADLNWLSRGPDAMSAAARPVNVRLASSTAADELPLEADPDEESEDGGELAPEDGRSLPLQTATPTEKATGVKALLRSFATTLKGLVVRKADSRPVSLPEEELTALFDASLPLPIESFPIAKLKDSFTAPRGRHRRHHAIDLPAVRGTPIVAVTDGTIERLGRDRRGGKVIYLRDRTGKFIFYYAHLARHASGLRVGDTVQKGQKLGEVGSTGHVIGGPHLHFAIFRDSDKPSPWKGLAVNPYLVFSTYLAR